MSSPERLAEPRAQPKLLSIDEALALVEAHVAPLPAEEVALEQAYGRYIAQELHAAVDLPPFASSAMDGYALRAEDSPGTLTVVGESSAGSPYGGELGAGQAVAISTGAVVPAQADSVVPIERVTGTRERIELTAAVEPGSFVRDRGSDIERGEKILEAGTRLGSAQIGAAAAVGLATVLCRRRPSVAVLTTGTELRPPGEPLAEGQIYDANGPMLTAALLTSGAGVEHIPAAADTEEAHRAALTRRSSTTSSSARGACQWVRTTWCEASGRNSAFARCSGGSRFGRASPLHSACAARRWSSDCPGTRYRASYASSSSYARRCSPSRAQGASGRRGSRASLAPRYSATPSATT